MTAPLYHDEYGNEFAGPYGTAGFLDDGVASHPTLAAAREAAAAALSSTNHTVTVYGPPARVTERRARVLEVMRHE